MEPIFQQDFQIQGLCVDRYGRLKPSTLLYFAQEIAGRHCDELADTLESHRLFWAVTRHRVQINRLPELGETVHIETWPMPNTHVGYPRSIVIYDQAGNECSRSISLWVLMDQDTRSSVSPDKSGIIVPGTLRGTELALPGGGMDLNIQGITIKSNGDLISSLANELYRARNPYIGDASADGRLSGTLGISRELGSFKNELQTSGEPYGWTLNFEESTSNSAVFEERMKAYACVLIALTDNLGQVSWNYTVELEQGSVLRHGTITEEECGEMVGAPVKTYADSPEGIEQLIKQLGIGR